MNPESTIGTLVAQRPSRSRVFERHGIDAPMARMEEEHREVGALLGRIKELTDDFHPPEHACGTWRACLDALSELDANTRAHIHLENEALHPRIRALQTVG